MDLKARQDLNNGFGNSLARAFELVVTPMVFIALGFGLGTWLGARPVLTFAFGAFGVIGTVVRRLYGYDLEMRAHERDAIWTRQQ